MIFIRLFFEFFRTGLFSVGGGLATVPFLQDIAVRTGWYTSADLANMIAVAESTPGPLGVNMATYVGYTTAGVPGAVIATLGLISPSIIVILIISAFLQKFRSSRGVEAVFYGLRPASTGLIAAACMSVVAISLFHLSAWNGTFSSIVSVVNWKSMLLALVLLFLTQHKKLKKLHPIIWIGAAAVAGILLKI